jgi:hypothetical protein
MLRVVAAVCSASCAAIIPGFIEVQFRDWLRAGGALGVFCVIWFTNPPAAITNAIPHPSDLAISGRWLADAERVLVCTQTLDHAKCSLNNEKFTQTLDGKFIDSRTVQGRFVRISTTTKCSTETAFIITLISESVLSFRWSIDAPSCDLPAGFSSFDPLFVRQHD